MENKKSITLVLALFLLGGGFYYYALTRPQTPVDTGGKISVENQNLATTSVEVLNPDGTTSSVHPLTKEAIDKIPKPSLVSKVNYNASLPVYLKAEMEQQVFRSRGIVLDTPYSPDAWSTLGSTYTLAGDVEAARAVWEYVAKISPEGITAYQNLGDLYHHTIKDFPKAETYLKKVVELNPSYVKGYRNLFDLYNVDYKKDTTSAEDILKEGIAKNSDAYELMISLGLYYERKGDKSAAMVQYKRALGVAKKIGSKELQSGIEEQLKKL